MTEITSPAYVVVRLESPRYLRHLPADGYTWDTLPHACKFYGDAGKARAEIFAGDTPGAVVENVDELLARLEQDSRAVVFEAQLREILPAGSPALAKLDELMAGPGSTLDKLKALARELAPVEELVDTGRTRLEHPTPHAIRSRPGPLYEAKTAATRYSDVSALEANVLARAQEERTRRNAYGFLPAAIATILGNVDAVNDVLSRVAHRTPEPKPWYVTQTPEAAKRSQSAAEAKRARKAAKHRTLGQRTATAATVREALAERVRADEQARPPECEALRPGQKLWNAAAALYPAIVERFRAGPLDPFHDDGKVDAFTDAIAFEVAACPPVKA